MTLPAGSRSPRPTNEWYNQVTEAAREHRRNKQRQSSGSSMEGRLGESSLPVKIKNEHATAIPSFGLTRWGGSPIKSASIADGVPDLALRTKSSNTSDPIGVVVDYIKNGNYGPVQVMGVSWARVFGEFNAGDLLMPNDDFQGVLDTSGASSVTALANGPGEDTEGIVPVFIGAVSAGCVRSYDLRLLWNPTAATLTISVRYNASTEVMNLTRTSEPDDIKAAIDAHSEFVIDEVECTVDGAGPLWSSNALVTLPAGAYIVGHSASMTRRELNPHPEFRVDICGCQE